MQWQGSVNDRDLGYLIGDLIFYKISYDPVLKKVFCYVSGFCLLRLEMMKVKVDQIVCQGGCHRACQKSPNPDFPIFESDKLKLTLNRGKNGNEFESTQESKAVENVIMLSTPSP